MEPVETLGDEQVHVGRLGGDSITLAVTCPRFGRIARVRVDRHQAAALAGVLTGLVLDEPDALGELAGA